MKDEYDLTTPKGQTEARKDLELAGAVIDSLFPTFAVWKWLGRRLDSYFANSKPRGIAAQKKAAIDLIKAGQSSGVSRMNIVMDQTAGIDLGSSVEGIPIHCKIGTSGHMVVEVIYK